MKNGRVVMLHGFEVRKGDIVLYKVRRKVRGSDERWEPLRLERVTNITDLSICIGPRADDRFIHGKADGGCNSPALSADPAEIQAFRAAQKEREAREQAAEKARQEHEARPARILAHQIDCWVNSQGMCDLDALEALGEDKLRQIVGLLGERKGSE